MRPFTSILAAALVAGCASTQPTPDAHATPAAELSTPLAGDSAVLTVFGLSCPLCANNVDKQLLRVDGVTGVTPDLQSGMFVVDFDPANPPTRGGLARAVKESGFTLVKIDTH